LIGKKYFSDLSKWGGLENLHQSKIIFDVQKNDGFVRFEETNYIRGWMGIPLLAKGRVIGILNLDSKTPGSFNSDHAAIVQTFANQAAIAIENIRLLELEQRRRSDAENLQLATSSLTNILDINNLLENVLDWLKKLVPYDSASIMLKKGDQLELAGKRDLPEIYKIGDTFTLSDKWKDATANHKPIIDEDVSKSDFFIKLESTDYIRGWMSGAMFTKDE